MKKFIKEKLNKALFEVEISKHAYQRAEERVWGTKKLTFGGENPDPPSLNKPAWHQSDIFNKATVRTATSGDIEIPVTDAVRTIIDRLNFLIHELSIHVKLGTFEGRKEVIVLLLEHFNTQQRGGGIWGSELTAIVGTDGKVLSIDWQNPQDLSGLKLSSMSKTKYVVSVAYLIKNNIKELTDDNIASIALYPKLKTQKPTEPKDEKFKKIKLSDGTMVKFFPTSNKFKSMNDEDLNFDNTFQKLAPEIQDYVFSNLNQ
jgi:hypothetical protein